MPLSVTDVSETQGYIIGIMDRADHHAGHVKEVALAIAGAIV
jgi:Integron cassette protein VCH_CASS1 chain